jgi:aryl-alcohol dehydrogenase-like predicted oxidoreductase
VLYARTARIARRQSDRQRRDDPSVPAGSSADAVRAIAQETGKSASAVSIAWLLARPEVTSVIFGARTVEQLETNLAGAELELTSGQLAALDQASAFDLGYPYAFIAATQSSW